MDMLDRRVTAGAWVIYQPVSNLFFRFEGDTVFSIGFTIAALATRFNSYAVAKKATEWLLLVRPDFDLGTVEVVWLSAFNYFGVITYSLNDELDNFKFVGNKSLSRGLSPVLSQVRNASMVKFSSDQIATSFVEQLSKCEQDWVLQTEAGELFYSKVRRMELGVAVRAVSVACLKIEYPKLNPQGGYQGINSKRTRVITLQEEK